MTEDYRLAFALYDRNSDGVLTMDEIEASLRGMGFHNVSREQILAATGGASVIGYEGFVAICKRQQAVSAAAQPEDPMRTMFNLFDLDGDGRITVAELKATLVRIGEILPPGEAERMHKACDLNGDGVLDFGEFVTMMQAK